LFCHSEEFMRQNIVKDKSFQFALDIISFNRLLLDKKEFVMSRQLLRSATSIGANVEEAAAAQTKKDFIFKMSIASKEARETNYWLRLLKASALIDYGVDDLLMKSEELKKILTSIVKTSQERKTKS
jgi:four helix bundle protein